MKNLTISEKLSANKTLFILWAVIAAFGAYFCTYAFRKPYTAGTFENLTVWDFDYKIIVVIAQIIGYMFSKFIGIKIISELKPQHRILLISLLVVFAEFSLFLFSKVPAPYNIPFMFLNGLPLGMIWGIVFSFLEGRRFTELLGLGLSLNMIITSGILKTLYLSIQQKYHFTDFEMPAIIGLLAFPFFLFFVWMLAQLPAPTAEEINLKNKRQPMSRQDKREAWNRYGAGIIVIILIYAFLTSLRDFRDNFAVEIWSSIAPSHQISIYTKSELIIGISVILIIATIGFFKSNRKAFGLINILMMLSFISLLFSTSLFTNDQLTPKTWMIILGVSFYLPYLILQIAFFERLIPFLQSNANAGYFVYLCDSVGYMGSVGLLIYKGLFEVQLDYASVMIRFTQGFAFVGLGLLVIQFIFFRLTMTRKTKLVPDRVY